ncbi:DUF427 domain-containing protein [Egicoccus sp. AB-alg2]|uniref:DUF427 domain-containing protein n=1 Tax=Egicoccus sp. AB-alg2 TaxID=3242693 RepID=UPI00359E47CD
MPKAVWNGVVIAQSDRTIMIEGNHYFPPGSVDRSLLREADKTTRCPWKGKASYFDLVVEGRVNSAAAWTYPDPRSKVAHIKDHIAFWGGVQVG